MSTARPHATAMSANRLENAPFTRERTFPSPTPFLIPASIKPVADEVEMITGRSVRNTSFKPDLDLGDQVLDRRASMADHRMGLGGEHVRIDLRGPGQEESTDRRVCLLPQDLRSVGSEPRYPSARLNAYRTLSTDLPTDQHRLAGETVLAEVGQGEVRSHHPPPGRSASSSPSTSTENDGDVARWSPSTVTTTPRAVPEV